MASPTEDSLVEQLAPRLPVFALVHEDSINPGRAKKVSTDTAPWKGVAGDAMDAATLIVFAVTAFSPGVTFELDRLDARGLWGKVWVLVSKELEAGLAAKWPNSARALVREMADLASPLGVLVTLPAKVAAFLDEVFSARQPRRE